MKIDLGTHELLNRVQGSYEPAELFEGLDEKNLLDFEREWKPIVDGQSPDEISSIEGVAADAGDAHWDWRRLAEIRKNPLLYSMYAVECARMTQGFMLIAKGARFSRHPDHPRADLIYVDRLATASWNRTGFVKQPIYKGVGQLLLAAAVSVSMDEELEGRLGLHSLAGAETFYRDVLGMTDFGPDDGYYGLCYFEFSAAQAAAFLG